jgi:acid stress chaperone HdeA
MNQLSKVAVIVGLLLGGGVSGAVAATPYRASMTCKEFLSIDDVSRPGVVYWAEGVNHKGKPEDAVIDVGATNRLVPVITEECKARPQASFWRQMDAAWHRAEADVKRHL